jgi:hypothetical protein
MSTKFLSPGWRMPRNANQSKSSNYSLDFNGDFINIGNENYVTTSSFNISISAWINIDTTSGEKTIVASGQNGSGAYDYRLNVDTNNNVYFSARTTSGSPYYTTITGGTTLSTNTWYHVCATWDMANFNLYLNGVSDATAVSATTYFNDSGVKRISIGYQLNSDAGGYRPFYGKITEVSIFDYALSPSQVTTIWGGGTSVSNPMALPSSPIAYYPLGTSSFNGEYLAENNAIGDYVFDFIPTNDVNAGHIDFFDSSTTLSISGWFNFDDISVNRDLMSQWVGNTTNGSFSLRRSSGNLLIVFIRTGSSSSGSDYYYANLATSSTGHSVGVWYHLAVTLDNGTCLIYLNGQALTTSIGGSPQVTLQASTADFKLGYWQTSTTSFDGKMSNIKLWSSKLEATEVETLYNYGSPIRTLANIPQSSNLKAWYKLDASEVYNSTTTEWSIDNNQNPSAYPSSLDFDAASSDYIQINNGSSLTNGFSELTVSIWANFSSNLSEQQIISKDGTSQRSWILRKLSSGVNFLVSTNGTSASQTLFYPNANITLGRWYHFVGIYDGSKLLLYVDGVLIDDSVSLTGSLPSTTSGLFIGSYDYNNSTTFDGKLSNAQVFNTALPATGSNSVETLYNNGSPLNSMTGFTSLVSWWKLNNTTTGIEDAEGSNNGTNNGATEYPGFVNT